MKTAQIPYELFVDLVLYHLNGEDDFYEDIQREKKQKRGFLLGKLLLPIPFPFGLAVLFILQTVLPCHKPGLPKSLA